MKKKSSLMLMVAFFFTAIPCAWVSSTSTTHTQEVQKHVEEIARSSYHINGKEIPKEILAAILVSLNPVDLYNASLVNKAWHDVAARIMFDNLTKKGKTLKPFTLDNVASNYLGLFYCPHLNEKENGIAFLKSLGNPTKGEFDKYHFMFENRRWFIDNKDLNRLDNSIEKLLDRGFYKSYQPSPETFPFLKAEFVSAPPLRLRCFYQTDIKSEKLFHITTLLP